jgi:Mrp family chromosome partitioning ATPase
MAAPVLPSEPPLADPRAEAPAGEQDPVLAAAAQAWDQAVRTNNVPGFAVVGSPGGRVAESNPPPPASAGGSLPREDGPARLAHRVHKVTQPLGSFLPDSLTEGSSYPYGTQEAPQPSYPSPVAGSRPVAAPTYPPRSPLPVKGPPSAATSYSYVSAAPVTASGVVRVEQLTGWVQPSELKPGTQRQICEQLYPFAVDRSLVTVVVAVPAAIEFKSRVAAELALALAASGHPRVLLLEADFHRPRVHRTLRVDMPMGCGFSQQLHARIHSGQRPSWAVVGCTPTLHVAAEGMMRSPGLLGSQFFDEAVRDFKSYYDFIVIDGPSSSLEVDSGPLNAVSDALVVVSPPNDADSLLQVNALFEQKRVSAVAVIPAT